MCYVRDDVPHYWSQIKKYKEKCFRCLGIAKELDANFSIELQASLLKSELEQCHGVADQHVHGSVAIGQDWGEMATPRASDERVREAPEIDSEIEMFTPRAS